MTRLILMRHAKSSWDDPAQRDFYRPLNDRGRRSAPLVGAWLAARGLVPGHALVSTAARARETWELAAASLGAAVPAALVPDLYHADPKTLLKLVRAAPRVETLLVLGHQPGIGEAARRLLADPPENEIFEKFPTAATAVIDFDAELWPGIGWGKGRLAEFVTPRELEAA